MNRFNGQGKPPSLLGGSPSNMQSGGQFGSPVTMPPPPTDPAYGQIQQNILNGYGTIADYGTYKNTGQIPQYPGMTPAPSAQAGGGISYDYQPPPTGPHPESPPPTGGGISYDYQPPPSGPHPEAPMPQPSVNPPVQYDYQPQQNGPHPQAPPPTGGYQPPPGKQVGPPQTGPYNPNPPRGNSQFGHQQGNRQFGQQQGNQSPGMGALQQAVTNRGWGRR